MKSTPGLSAFEHWNMAEDCKWEQDEYPFPTTALGASYKAGYIHSHEPSVSQREDTDRYAT